MYWKNTNNKLEKKENISFQSKEDNNFNNYLNSSINLENNKTKFYNTKFQINKEAYKDFKTELFNEEYLNKNSEVLPNIEEDKVLIKYPKKEKRFDSSVNSFRDLKSIHESVVNFLFL